MALLANSAHVCGEIDQISMTRMRKFSVKFWKSSKSGSGLRIGLPWVQSSSGPDWPWQRCTLSKCSCYVLLLFICTGIDSLRQTVTWSQSEKVEGSVKHDALNLH